MRKEIMISAAIVLLAVFYLSSFTGLFVGVPTTRATRIIDGDTIEIEGGERVRLIGIDTPEKGQYLFEESKERLEELIGYREILLETDETDRDKYDRLLRYVFTKDGEHINEMLVREGLAEVLIYPPDSKYEKGLLEAEAEARSRGLGIWKYMNKQDIFCIGIFYFRFNAAGDDRKNLNDEYIEFRNKCTYPVDMTDWSVEDALSHEYIFPKFVAQNKTKFKLHTGIGNDNSTDLYWNSKMPIWNNAAGDTMKMWSAEGQLILNYLYEGY